MKSYKPLLANVAAQTIFGLGYFFIKMGMAVVDQDTVKFLSRSICARPLMLIPPIPIKCT